MKKTILWPTAAALLLAYACLSYLGSNRAAPLYTIESEILLPADPERSWQALTDFETYSEWNPYMPRAEGEFAPGAELSFTIVDANFDEPLELRARFGEIVPHERFHWIGVLGFRGLHDTRHGFTLRPEADGSTRLRQYEEFRGVLAWLLPDREERITKTRASFDVMNQALRKRLAH